MGGVAFGFVIGRSDMGDPSLFSQEGLVSGEQSVLTVLSLTPKSAPHQKT